MKTQVQVQNAYFLRFLNLRHRLSTFRKSNVIRMRTDFLVVVCFLMVLLLTYRFVRFVRLLKTSCGRFSTLLFDRSLKGSRGNALELSGNSEKSNTSRNVIRMKGHSIRKQKESSRGTIHQTPICFHTWRWMSTKLLQLYLDFRLFTHAS